MNLIHYKTSALLFTCLLLAVGIFAPVSAQSGADADLSRREVYEPVIERDRSTRYRVKQHFYKLKEEDVGTHDLTVRVREGKANGEEQIHDVRSFTLNVQPEGACEVPAVEMVYPLAGDILYNLFESASSPVDPPASSVTGVGISSYSEDCSGSEGCGGEPYTPAVFQLTVTQQANVTFSMFPPPGPEDQIVLFLFRGEGAVSEDSDYVENFFEYELTGIDGVAEIELEAGNYIAAATAGFLFSDGNGKLFYHCDGESCFEREDISFELTVSAEEAVLQLSGSYDPGGGLPPDYRPISVKASAPWGIDNVVLQTDFGQVELDTEDGVIYKLDLTNEDVLEVYRLGLFPDPPPDNIDVIATSVCESSTLLNVPLNIQPDPVPSVSLSTDIPLLQLNLGEQTHLSALIADAGRNVSSLHAVLFAPGTIPDSTGITPDNYNDMVLGEVATHHFFGDISRAESLSVDNFRFQLPVTVAPEGAVTGDYDLRLLAFDSTGQAGISAPLPVSILPSTVPPFLDVDLPEFRIPAGETAPVTFKVESLGPLDVLEIQASGAAFDTAVRSIDLDGAIEFEFKDSIRVAESATPGDLINLTVTAVARGGLISTFMGQIEVGEWGERTIVIGQDGEEEEVVSSMSMLYSNVIIEDQGELIHFDPDVRFNSIQVDGRLVTGSDDWLIDIPNPGSGKALSLIDEDGQPARMLPVLDVRERLEVGIDGFIEVPVIVSLKQGGEDNFGGAHGGNSDSGIAYDSIRTPMFPGASGGGEVYEDDGELFLDLTPGGGVLEIRTPELVLDGVIDAEGRDKLGSWSGYRGGGAGGSIIIRADHISGNGSVQVNGGDGYFTSSQNNYSGAGGRIAIYYENYDNSDVSVEEGLSLQAFSGTSLAGSDFLAAPGTVFVKRADELHGSLIVGFPYGDSPSYTGSMTTYLPSFPPAEISEVQDLGNNLYRIVVTRQEIDFPVPFLENWESGLIDLQVSLDAENRDAPLYTVIDNDENSFVVESQEPLQGLEGKRAICVDRFDKVITANGVNLHSYGRLYASEFQIADMEALRSVGDLQSDQVNDLDDYVINDANETFIGDTIADSLTITGESEVAVFGSLTVAGDVTSGSGGTEIFVRDDLSAGSMSLLGNSDFWASFEVGGNLSLSSGLTMTDYDLRVRGETSVIGGTLELDGAYLNVDGSLIVNDEVSLDNADLDVDESLTVNAEVTLNNGASLSAENMDVGGGASMTLINGSRVSVTNMLDVSDVLNVSTESEVNSRHIQADTIQFDGGDPALNDPVRLRTETVSADSVFVLLNAVASLSPGRAGITLSSGNQFILFADAVIDATEGVRSDDHPEFYPECAPAQPPRGSYGGLGNNPNVLNDCAYGGYDQADLPGSAYGSSEGSGAVRIIAESATINGDVLVHGSAGTNFMVSGGGIRIEAGQLIGGGTLQAYGGGGTASIFAAGGGRIAVLADNSADIRATPGDYPSYAAYGGVSAGRIAGAGTVFIANRDLSGKHLIVDNNGATAAVNSTPIRSVGRHNIALVAPLGNNRWEVSVAGSPWKPSDSLNDIGLAGRYVSLDAGNSVAPLYRVFSNTASTLVVEGDGGDIVYGAELIGVHEFETLDVKNGAYVDFGDDRVIVNDPANSQIDLTRIHASPDGVLQ